MGTDIFAQPRRSPELMMRFPTERLLVCVEGKDDREILKEFFLEYTTKGLIAFETPLLLEANCVAEAFAHLSSDRNAESSAPKSNGHEGVYRTVNRLHPEDERVFGLVDGDDLFKKNDPRIWNVDPNSIDSFGVEYWRYSKTGSSRRPPVYFVPRHEIENFLVELKVLDALAHGHLKRRVEKEADDPKTADSTSKKPRTIQEIRHDLYLICERVLLIGTLNVAIARQKAKCPEWTGAEISFSRRADKDSQTLADSLSKYLSKKWPEQYASIMEEWQVVLGKWQQLLEYDAAKQTMNLERVLRFFDGKAIFGEVCEFSAFDLSLRSSDECHVKSVWTKQVKNHHSVDVPYAPELLVRMLNHFLKELGEPSLRELYVRSLSGGRTTS